jgi:outer membrane protein assembly factor BamD
MTLTHGLSRFLFVAALVFALPGCKTIGGWFGGGDSQEPTETLPVEEMYAEGKVSLDGGNYDRAETYFQRLVSRFPYGPYSEQGLLNLAYAQYKKNEPEDATSTIDRFIRTYPTHRNIDYARYLKALINFDRDDSLLLRLARMDMSSRDLSAAQRSFADFAAVINLHPYSRYAPDSRQRMVYLRNLIARHDLNVGLYYLRRGAYVAAANRGKFIIETYPESEHRGDALALMAAAYEGLGEEQLAADTRKVLQSNHPDHPFLRGDWPNDGGWLSKFNPFGD